jgi:cellobiose epimerase
MDLTEIEAFSARVRRHLFGHILPFWTGPALDQEKGGWMSWLSNDLRPDRTQPKGLIVNVRLLWTFSAVHQFQPESLYRQMADRAYDFIMSRFWDSERGGAFWRVNDDGRVSDHLKKIYGQAFCIYALAEFHRAFSCAPALERAIELFGLVEGHAQDPEHGGYWEVRHRDWSEASDSRLSEKDLDEKKSMNNHLHLLEAYTNLYRSWKGPRVEQRLRELVQIFDQRILDPRNWHLHHAFDERWQVRSQTYTFGHDIEASWLLCEAAHVLGDMTLLQHVRDVALRIAQVVLVEGLDTDGALSYAGKDGAIIDAGKECWPQAEAVVGFLNAFQLSAQAKFLQAAKRVWDFIEGSLADRINGEWFWRIAPDGKPDLALPKVSEWKGPYHGSRACLETIRRLKEIAAGTGAASPRQPG